MPTKILELFRSGTPPQAELLDFQRRFRNLGKYIERLIGGRVPPDSKRHHVIITGTGRAGTTFLISLLTDLGLDTGYRDPNSEMFPYCNAGMERDIRANKSPYIVKSPNLCGRLSEILGSGRIVIDHAFIPVRDLYSAAESRRDVTRRAEVMGLTGKIAGGLWETKDGSSQETVLTEKLYKLIYEIAKFDIPMTLLSFPRIVEDPDYLCKKLRPVFPSLKRDPFLKAFHARSQPELVHSFDGVNRPELAITRE